MADEEEIVLSPDDSKGDEGNDDQQGDDQNDKQEDHWSTTLPENMRESFAGFDNLEAAQAALAGPVIPDAYAAPEGMEIDAANLESFSTTAKELGLTQDQMGGLLKFDHERSGKINEAIMEKADTDMKTGLDALKTKLGDAEYTATLNNSQAAIRAFADDETWQFLEDSRLGNHPALIKLFDRVGRALSEDALNPGDKGKGGEPKGQAEKIFGNVQFTNQQK